MTTFQWATLVLGSLGFLITWSGMIIGGTKWVEGIKTGVAEKLALEREETNRVVAAVESKFVADQKVQDHYFGEVNAAMRQYIANVEKEMHEIEIWGRDNFALKSEVEKSTNAIREDIKEMRADIKSDLRDLNTKIDKVP